MNQDDFYIHIEELLFSIHIMSEEVEIKNFLADELVNGTHEKTLYIVSHEFKSVHMPIKNHIELDINEYDFKTLKFVVEKYGRNHNIIIDSRMTYFILAGYVNFKDYLLIFDMGPGKIYKTSKFLGSNNLFNLHHHLFSSTDDLKLIYTYIMINYFFNVPEELIKDKTNQKKIQPITWNIFKVSEIVSRYNNLVELLLAYIKIHEISDDKEKVIRLTQSMISFIRGGCEDLPRERFDWNEIYTALIQLRNNNQMLKYF